MDYNTLASEESLKKTVNGLMDRGYGVVLVDTKEDALAKVKELIVPGASIMNGSSVTLEQIGFVDFLKEGQHVWNDLHENILKEPDKDKQAELRKMALLSDFYLGSVHAMIEDGRFIIASQSGSQLPHIVYSSKNLIFVLSTKKIVPDLANAMKRLEEHVIPLEEKHMREKYGIGTTPNKILIFQGEAKYLGRNVNFIFVKEDLGF